MPHLIALDEGTTSARSILYNERGERLGMESSPIDCDYPKPGWVEQDPLQIWRAQMDTVHRVLKSSGIAASALSGLGITNQRETTIVWDRETGTPVAPAIVWQCRRTSDWCQELAKRDGLGITKATGLVVDAYFSGSKIRWILDNTAGAHAKAKNGDLLFGTVDTWLIWKLTEGRVHVTDVSNASRTMLMNLATGDWDNDMLSIFDVPKAMLPKIVPSSGVVGTTSGAVFDAEVPIAGIAGDQQAALFGQACFRPGLSKNTYGTGCFGLMHTGARIPVSKNKLLATAAAQIDKPQYAVEGSVFIAGAAVQWLRDKMGLIQTAAESEAVAGSVTDTGGVYVVPAFVGLGAPHWDPNARGLITGITGGTTRAHIVRAALESIAFQTRELIEAMESDSGETLAELRVDGGATANNFLMQFQADILGKRIVRPADIETTALGAAYLAGLATGVWKSLDEVESFWRMERAFDPLMAPEARAQLWTGWKAAVSRCRG